MKRLIAILLVTIFLQGCFACAKSSTKGKGKLTKNTTAENVTNDRTDDDAVDIDQTLNIDARKPPKSPRETRKTTEVAKTTERTPEAVITTTTTKTTETTPEEKVLTLIAALALVYLALKTLGLARCILFILVVLVFIFRKQIEKIIMRRN